MKKILGILILGALLSGCFASNTYESRVKRAAKDNYYSAKAQSVSRSGWAAASDYTQQGAIDQAIAVCNDYNKTNDCVAQYIGNRYVFEESKQDYQIQSAQSICKKIGLTAGTDKFTDCIIKMMSQAQVQGQSQGGSTVIYGQRPYNKSVCVASGGLLC